MTMDINGNLYIANYGNHSITKVDGGGNITQFVGGGVDNNSAGQSGTQDSGYGTAGSTYPGGGAKFTNPLGIAISPDGVTLVVADTGNHNIRMIT
jgi:DNA-binding beta-propeller fold protein YncE